MIFISSPYSHSSKKIVQQRYKETCAYAAYLFSIGKTAISPVIVGHNLLGHADLPSDFMFWRKYSFELLIKCEELHVLELPDWHISTGVNAEIMKAHNWNVDVKYISKTDDGKYVET